MGRPSLPPSMLFNPSIPPPSPTPSQILYSFDHEPIYDTPPDTIPYQPGIQFYFIQNFYFIKSFTTIFKTLRISESVYERLPDRPAPPPPIPIRAESGGNGIDLPLPPPPLLPR